MLWLLVPARLLEKKLKFGVRWLAAFGCWRQFHQRVAQSDQSIYTDSLQNSWQNWGWATV